LKFEKSNLIHIQTKSNLVILTHKTRHINYTDNFFKKIWKTKNKGGLHIGTEGVDSNICIDTKVKAMDRESNDTMSV